MIAQTETTNYSRQYIYKTYSVIFVSVRKPLDTKPNQVETVGQPINTANLFVNQTSPI